MKLENHQHEFVLVCTTESQPVNEIIRESDVGLGAFLKLKCGVTTMLYKCKHASCPEFLKQECLGQIVQK